MEVRKNAGNVNLTMIAIIDTMNILSATIYVKRKMWLSTMEHIVHLTIHFLIWQTQRQMKRSIKKRVNV